MSRRLLQLALMLAVLVAAARANAQAGNTVILRFAGAPTGSCSPIAVAVNNATGAFYDCLAGSWNAVGGGGGSGTVTSVSFSGGLISVANPTTTPALTVAGTSGGIPYFSGAATWASSAALTVNLPIIGGGVGAAPTVGTVTGNTTQFATWTGATTGSRCVQTDANGNLTIAAAACASGSGTVTSVLGTTNQITSDGNTVTPTLSIPATFIPPGVLEVTGPSPYYDVLANGLVADGTTNNSTALQAIVNGCSATLGCRIFFPCGVYKFNTGITTGTAQGITFEGATNSGWGNSTVRCARLTTASTITILSMGNTSGSIQNGGAVRNLSFEDTSGAGTAVGGLLITRSSRIPVEHCEFDSFTGSGHYGIKYDGDVDFDNHNSIWDVRMRAVQNGIIIVNGNDGPDIFGGDIALDASATAPIGIDIQPTASASVKIFGTSIDVLGSGTPIGIKIAGDSNFISGVKLEGATPLATCTAATCIGVQVTATGANNQINIANSTKLNTVVQLAASSSGNYVSGVGVNNDNDVTDSGDLNDAFWNGSNTHFLQVHTTTTSLASPWKIEGVTQPGSGSVKLTRMLVPSGRGLIFQQTTGNSGGGYLNADSAIRGCIGFGLYGSCSTSGVTASGTSATLVVGGNTAGQFDFYTDTSLTAGNTFTPTLRASLNATGLTIPGAVSAATYASATNCAAAGSAASPSAVACSAAPAGSFSCATNASTATCVVSTTAVTANSRIFVQPSAAEGSNLSVTCNTTADTGLTAPRLASKSAGTSFTINLGTFATNPVCFNYWIVN